MKLRGSNKLLLNTAYSRMIWPELSVGSSGSICYRQLSHLWHGPLQHQPHEYEPKPWDYTLSQTIKILRFFLKLTFSGFLGFHKHITKSFSPLQHSWKFIQVICRNICIPNICNRARTATRITKHKCRYPGFLTGHLTDLKTALATNPVF